MGGGLSKAGVAHTRGVRDRDSFVGKAILWGLTAQHPDLIVEAHPDITLLVPVLAHQALAEVALHHLAQLLDADLGVALGPALQLRDVLGTAADFLSPFLDVAVGFHVSSVGPRGREVHVKPLGPRALWLAGASHMSGVGCFRRENRGCAGCRSRRCAGFVH